MNRKQRRAAAKRSAPTKAEALYRAVHDHHQRGAMEDAIAAYSEAVALAISATIRPGATCAPPRPASSVPPPPRRGRPPPTAISAT
ncbi:MAG: hypothetical protein VCB77_01360 [Alphaproteobacteria bacterium]